MIHVDQLTQFHKWVPITCLLITKVDLVDTKIGFLISLAFVTEKPILFLGTGQTYHALTFCDTVKFIENFI